jgi:hypothetical protein
VRWSGKRVPAKTCSDATLVQRSPTLGDAGKLTVNATGVRTTGYRLDELGVGSS